MSWIVRSAARAGVAVGLVLALVGVSAVAASAGSGEIVKYYTVTRAYNGAPESLTGIAARLLGSGARAHEVFNLNAGRRQADGSALTDPSRLRPGWLLVLPWDAVGAGVQQGELPERAKPAATAPVWPEKLAARSSGDRGRPSSSEGPACGARAGASGAKADWARLRMAPGRAWSRTRGNGITVAVVDSGVDSSLPQLSGRVVVGADVTSGSGRGDVDCLGTGTAMAGLIAGSQEPDNGPTGIAPDATILPVRVVTTRPEAEPAHDVAAISVAVAAGASVIALGSYVDLTDASVLAAVSAALTHDVLVVAPAPVQAVPGPSPPGAGARGALLSVGGVSADNRLADDYHPASVDVVAPGVGVAGLGHSGYGTFEVSGTQYAVAFVAGQAALVRAAFPELSAAQVKHRIEATTDRLGSGAPDQRYGWGLINPPAAVTAQVAGEHAVPAGTDSTGSGAMRTVVLVMVVLALLVAVAVLLLRARGWTRDVHP
ncbi:S8 family serine peptidase [Actinoplanes sp. NBRC 103695]|uniref:S8 family serine peptidase n=1 Tax=Actinoplanes sp. NBRC 103695 TaxID=3032202 RepID=UPI0024A0B83E|nr:S8 family serine peptidase [Actinoplanes sp. NBRC 103695]GLY97265.1 hypothetical protein Acsp02_45190 [Actinoplanes sp. NBRC 103695]